jgi:hypothetical protein
MGEKRNWYKLLLGKAERKSSLGRPRYREWLILRWNIERDNGVAWTGLVRLRIGTSGELV